MDTLANVWAIMRTDALNTFRETRWLPIDIEVTWIIMCVLHIGYICVCSTVCTCTLQLLHMVHICVHKHTHTHTHICIAHALFFRDQLYYTYQVLK